MENKLTDKMIEEIKTRITKKLKAELGYNYTPIEFMHGDFLEIGISSTGDILAGMVLRKNKDDILAWINNSTGLYWECDGPYYKLVGGYVILSETFDKFKLEQYNEIDGIELHSPVLFRDGINVTCSSLYARCECEVFTWEPNIESFDFAPIMPGEDL